MPAQPAATRGQTRWLPIAVLLLIVLAVGVGGTLYLTGQIGGNKEILLEALADPGPDPFTPPLGPLPSAETSGASAPANSATPSPPETSVAASAPVPNATAAEPTLNPGQQATPLAIYGGSGSDVVCDKDKLIAFLEANPTKAAAWASVLGIKPDQIAAFVAPLEPAVLRHDTRVTNHGFANGAATERQSILQAGTHVLLDASGVPVARCLCGNPLLPAKPVNGTATYAGTKWPGFNPSGVVASTQQPVSLQPSAVTSAAVVASSSSSAAVTSQPSLATPEATPAQPPSETPAASESPIPGLTFTPAAGNLVNDGGFETGIVAPWGSGIYEPRPEIFWGSAQASATVVSSDVHSGSSALQITNATPIAPQVYRTMSQAVPVTAGAQYCLTFWAKSVDSTPGILSFPLNRAWSARIAAQPGTYDWTEYAGTATTEATSFDVRLITENTGSILIDDIELTPGACAVPVGPVPPGQSPR